MLHRLVSGDFFLPTCIFCLSDVRFLKLRQLVTKNKLYCGSFSRLDKIFLHITRKISHGTIITAARVTDRWLGRLMDLHRCCLRSRCLHHRESFRAHTGVQSHRRDTHKILVGTSHQLQQQTQYKTRMWANAQRDGRPAEHRRCPLFNAAKFG